MAIRKDMFHKDELKKAEEDFSKVQYKKNQRDIIISLSKVLCEYIPISDVAMRGFMSSSIREWQKKEGKTISDVIQMAPQDRANNVKEMFINLANRLVKVLRTSDNEKVVRNGVNSAFDSYVKKFATR